LRGTQIPGHPGAKNVHHICRWGRHYPAITFFSTWP